MKVSFLKLTFLFLFVMTLLGSCRPMCPILSCQIRYLHPHSQVAVPPKWQKKLDKQKEKTKKEVPFLWRGSYWWKKQNARYAERHRADAKKKIFRKKIKKKKQKGMEK